MALSALATLKLILLLASGIAQHISTTPPNPPPQKTLQRNFFEKYVYLIISIVILPLWLVVILDMVATALTAGGGDSILVPERANVQALQQPSPAFILSAVLLIATAIFRVRCYKALGDQFRFEVSIQSRHKLVTSGPYSFVRHPAYLALYGYYIGTLSLLTSRGTYLRECVLSPSFHAVTCKMFPGSGVGCEEAISSVGKFHVVAMIGFAVWLVDLLFIERHLFGRMSWEDDVLHKEFGREWELYAERVRWRILPGIL